MQRAVTTITLGGAALLMAARFPPPTGLTLAALGLACMFATILRRKRQLALAAL